MIWHFVGMSDIPRNSYRRFTVNEKGEVFRNLALSGEGALAYSRLLLPAPQETRTSILRIRRKFRISRAQLGASLGIGKDTLRRWETGERSPCTAARRLVQLVEAIFFSDQSLLAGFDNLLIGRIDLKALETVKSELLPASAHHFLKRFERNEAKRKPQQL